MMIDEFLDSYLIKLDAVLKKHLIDNGLGELVDFSKIFQHWEVIIGTPLAGKTKPIKLEKKVLYILVEDAAYAHHMRYFEKNILDLISSPEICGDSVVRKIRYRVGALKESRIDMTIPEIQRKKVIETDPAASNQAQWVSRQIGDEKLKKRFSRFMAKSTSKTKNQT